MTRRRALTVLGMVLLLVGLLWVAQGLGLVGGSFMSGDDTWFVIGTVVALVGVLLLFTGRHRGGPDRRP